MNKELSEPESKDSTPSSHETGDKNHICNHITYPSGNAETGDKSPIEGISPVMQAWLTAMLLGCRRRVEGPHDSERIREQLNLHPDPDDD